MLSVTLLLMSVSKPLFTDLASLPPPEFPTAGQTRTVEIEVPPPAFPWDEAIVSWNVKRAEGASLSLEAKVVQPAAESSWLGLGRWAIRNDLAPRESQKGQGDDVASVDTDTLLLKRSGGRLRLRLTLSTLAEQPSPDFSGLWVSFSTKGPVPESQRLPATPILDVPQRCQGDYPNGGVLCSPTSLSMLMAYWADKTNQPNLDRGVPEVVREVFDPVWGGTGNWPFNLAHPGSFPGMAGLVARLSGVEEIHGLVKQGIPVATSVSYGLLKGKPSPDPDDGHLVVVVGFDANGDPVFNDPGRARVRNTYRLADFARAWNRSRNTVYLVFPSTMRFPLPCRQIRG